MHAGVEEKNAVADVEELLCITVWEEEEERMRKIRSWEGKSSFFVDGGSVQRRCEPRRERNQYSAQRLCVSMCQCVSV